MKKLVRAISMLPLNVINNNEIEYYLIVRVNGQIGTLNCEYTTEDNEIDREVNGAMLMLRDNLMDAINARINASDKLASTKQFLNKIISECNGYMEVCNEILL